MDRKDEELRIENTVSFKDKEILETALDGIYGWNFNPIAVITDGEQEYYFICKVKTIIKSVQMTMAKIYVKIQKNKPRLLAIEEIR